MNERSGSADSHCEHLFLNLNIYTSWTCSVSVGTFWIWAWTSQTHQTLNLLLHICSGLLMSVMGLSMRAFHVRWEEDGKISEGRGGWRKGFRGREGRKQGRKVGRKQGRKEGRSPLIRTTQLIIVFLLQTGVRRPPTTPRRWARTTWASLCPPARSAPALPTGPPKPKLHWTRSPRDTATQVRPRERWTTQRNVFSLSKHCHTFHCITETYFWRVSLKGTVHPNNEIHSSPPWCL